VGLTPRRGLPGGCSPRNGGLERVALAVVNYRGADRADPGRRAEMGGLAVRRRHLRVTNPYTGGPCCRRSAAPSALRAGCTPSSPSHGLGGLPGRAGLSLTIVDGVTLEWKRERTSSSGWEITSSHRRRRRRRACSPHDGRSFARSASNARRQPRGRPDAARDLDLTAGTCRGSAPQGPRCLRDSAGRIGIRRRRAPCGGDRRARARRERARQRRQEQ